MDEKSLRDMAAGGESLCVEFKRNLNSDKPKQICKEIAAFASTEGGCVLIGVADDSTIVGIDQAKEIALRSKIERWVNSYVTPIPIVDLETSVADGRIVLGVNVRKGVSPVYFCEGIPYVRVGSSSHVVSNKELAERLFRWSFRSDLDELKKRVEGMPNPAAMVASAITGQGELATMNYQRLKERLLADFPHLGLNSNASENPNST